MRLTRDTLPVMEEMMHVGICIYDTAEGRVGGPIAWALDFVPFLATQFQTTALVLRPGGFSGSNVVDLLSKRGIRCVSLDTNESGLLDCQVEWIYEQCRRLGIVILIANLVLPGFYAAEGLRRAGVVTVGVLHSHPGYDPYYRDLVDVFSCAGSVAVDCMVAVSRQIANCVELHSSQCLRVEVIPCGTREVTVTCDQDTDNLQMVYAGRIVEFAKRVHATTDAMLMASRELKVSGTIYGDGDEKEWVCTRLRNQSKITYGGFVPPSSIQSVLCQYQIFVLLSDFEGLPISLVEAMACGLVPVALSAAPGMAEVIVNGENGILVADRSESFVEAIRMLQDVELRKKLSEGARKTIAQHYLHSVTFSKWRELLVQLAPTAICPQKIPRKCVIKNRGTRFCDYPPNRPTAAVLAKQWLLQNWYSLKNAIRPRARLRSLMCRSRSPKKLE
ncbi:MAG: glycosyltransferase family 4 protein [Planctomycetaceae bacterium]|nr:glycosyltransferase family 4 protein [Planctomycetaceae bacterium]